MGSVTNSSNARSRSRRKSTPSRPDIASRASRSNPAFVLVSAIQRSPRPIDQPATKAYQRGRICRPKASARSPRRRVRCSDEPRPAYPSNQMELPTGTVTFLFTDIEGSTGLLSELGEDFGPVQDDQMRLMREAIAAEQGTEIRTEGDAFFVVFPTAAAAVRAAAEAQRGFASHSGTH